MSITIIVGLLIAGIGMPLFYAALCSHLSKQEEPPLVFVAYFILCGITGGWAFAFAMSPSGMAASSLVFLGTIAPIASVCSSVALSFKNERSREASIAMTLGYIYPLTLIALAFIGSLIA